LNSLVEKIIQEIKIYVSDIFGQRIWELSNCGRDRCHGCLYPGYGKVFLLIFITESLIKLFSDGVTKELFNEAIEKFPAPGQILGPKKRGYW